LELCFRIIVENRKNYSRNIILQDKTPWLAFLTSFNGNAEAKEEGEDVLTREEKKMKSWEK